MESAGLRAWVSSFLPDFFFEVKIWQVELWQWCVLLTVVVVSWCLAWVAVPAFVAVLRRGVGKTKATWDDQVVDSLARPARVAMIALLAFLASPALGLTGVAREGLLKGFQVAAVLILGWVVSAWVSVAARRLEQSVASISDQVIRGFVPIIARIAKVGVWALVTVVSLDMVGIEVLGLVAGLGIGGLAVAFAAQKTIENLFGSVAIAADRPFEVGSVVTLGGITGTVEEVGLRSTRIRTLGRTLVTLPNRTLLNERVENLSVRDRLVYQQTISLLPVTTAEQVELIIDEVKKLLHAHPKIWQELVRVRLAGFGESAINLEVLTYVDTTDYNEFTAVKEQIGLAILRIVARAGTSLVSGPQALLGSTATAFDEDKARRAADEVARRRDRGELWIPEPPELEG